MMPGSDGAGRRHEEFVDVSDTLALAWPRFAMSLMRRASQWRAGFPIGVGSDEELRGVVPMTASLP
jgi:hypothetical protein